MSRPFETHALPAEPSGTAPDGSVVRVLAELAGGGVAHFELAAGATSVPVRHRTVEEIWYVVAGRGEMWRDDGRADPQPVALEPRVSVTIPLGTAFQFRSFGPRPLEVVAVTMPPWPGAGEAIRAAGPWSATVRPGPGLADR